MAGLGKVAHMLTGWRGDGKKERQQGGGAEEKGMKDGEGG